MEMISLGDFLEAMKEEISLGNTTAESPIVVQVGEKVYVINGVNMIGGAYEVTPGGNAPLMLTAIQTGDELSEKGGECPCPACVARRRAQTSPKKQLKTNPKLH